MNLQKLDGQIVLRIIALFAIGILYGILDRGKFEASFIGNGISHLVISYILGLLSFYVYKFTLQKKSWNKNNRKVVVWNISVGWALFVLFWLGFF